VKTPVYSLPSIVLFVIFSGKTSSALVVLESSGSWRQTRCLRARLVAVGALLAVIAVRQGGSLGRRIEHARATSQAPITQLVTKSHANLHSQTASDAGERSPAHHHNMRHGTTAAHLSFVTTTSHSMKSAPCCTARLYASSVSSGSRPLLPRCATTKGFSPRSAASEMPPAPASATQVVDVRH
jgi:hypothetical protein